MDSPLILLPDVHTVHFEEDCACSSSSFTPVANNLQIEGLWQTFPHLQKTNLNPSFKAIFNPLGNFSLAVMNESALSLLDMFNTPTSLSSISEKNPDTSREDLLKAAREMIALGMLQNSVQPTTRPNQGLPEMLTAWLHLTNECNLRCDYCYLHKTQECMSLEKGQQAVDAVFRSAKAQSFRRVKLKYAGGEATLEFDLILQLHDYAQDHANRLGLELAGVVLSNGIGISDKMIAALKQRNIRLAISLDGIGEYHDVQRKFQNGRGSFALVEKSLDRLARQDFKPSLTITVSQRSAEGLPQVVEYLLERELPFTINFYRANEHSASFEDLVYQDEQMILAMKAAFAKIEDNLPPFSILGAITDRARLDAPHQQPCGVGNSYMVVDQNGNVAKCHMEINKKITDITSADPLKVLQLDKTGIQNISVEEREGCRTCEWRYSCAGGCPALTYRVTGRYDVKSPNCRIYKALFPEVIRLEGLRILKYSSTQLPG